MDPRAPGGRPPDDRPWWQAPNAHPGDHPPTSWHPQGGPPGQQPPPWWLPEVPILNDDQLPPRTGGRQLGGPGQVSKGRPRAAPFLIATVAVLAMSLAAWFLVVVPSEVIRTRTPGPERSSGVTVTATAAPTTKKPTTTTTSPPGLAFLEGRAPSPVELDPAVCSAPLRPGALYPSDWSAWEPDGPLPAAAPTEEEMRTEIATVMSRRFRTRDPEKAIAGALSLFDDARLREITDDNATLRAALVELKGTMGESALAFVLSPTSSISIAFGKTANDDVGAQAQSDGENLWITVSDEYRDERPALLTAVLFHELQHQGMSADSGKFDEEMVANALQQRVTIEQLRDAPEAITPKTRLGGVVRWQLLAQLNTRVGSELTLTRSEATTVFPNTVDPSPRSFAEFLRSKPGEGYSLTPDGPSPGHPTLRTSLRQMSEDPAAVPPMADFDPDTIAFIDSHPGVGSCDQLIAAQAIGVLRPGAAATRAAAGYIAGLP